MAHEIFEKLREQIDQYSVGFNATPSGIEIKILQKIFTEDEAQMYLVLTRNLEPLDEIAKRARKDPAEVMTVLDSMGKKGLLFPRKKGKTIYYAAAPFMHGFFEHQALTVMDKELAEMYQEYFKGGFFPKAVGMRTIPVNVTLEHDKIILPYDDVKKIIESKDRIALFNCACASNMNKLETGCDKPLEVCIAFDYYAEYPIEHYGVGRWISKEEALKVLEETEKAGFVHQTGGDSRNIECICNCCPECCLSLNVYKAFPQSAKLSGSNYFAKVIPDECSLCGICIDRCPMGAIRIGVDRIEINLDKCIGCGLCESQCADEAIKLMKKADDKIRGPRPPEKYTFMRSSVDFDSDVGKD